MLAAARNEQTHAPGNRLAGSARADTDERDDELAIVRSAQHDPAALAPLYERYVDAVHAYCYRRTSDRELAADLTHQIFARVLTALPQFAQRPNGSFRSWLFTIAHNLVVDTHRLKKETASLDRAGPDRLYDDARSPEEHAIAGEQRRALNAAMRQLTDGQRQVVELRLAGLTGPEIAAALDMRLAAVKSTQFRAYARLRDLLGDALDPRSTIDA
jgi:RNA polymerase sigma-70 factor (ECF subfamily)